MSTVGAPIPPAADSRPRAGAPRLFATMICDAIRNRQSLRSICEELELDRRDVSAWLLADPAFAAEYELARGIRFDDMAEECLSIADDTHNDTLIDRHGGRRPNKEWIARSRVKIDTRLRLLALFDPQKYGAKLEVNSTNRNLNLTVAIGTDPNEAAAAYRDVIEGRPSGS